MVPLHLALRAVVALALFRFVGGASLWNSGNADLKAHGAPDSEVSAKLVSDLGLSRHQYDELFSKALKDHVKENDCYRSVTESVRIHGLSSSLSDEMLRKRGAIALFLCDSAEDSISFPQECKADVSAFEWSEDHVRGCVHALHRVPQQWASFDNHRKTFPLLCFAQLQKEGVDEARSLYRDIAVQQQNFLFHLHGIAKEREQGYEALERRAVTALEQLQQEARRLQSHQAEVIRAHVEATLARLSTSIENVALRSAANLTRAGREALWSSVRMIQKRADEVLEASVLQASAASQQQYRNITMQTTAFQALVQQTFSSEGPLSRALHSYHQQQEEAALQLRTQSSQSHRFAQEVRDAVSSLRDTVFDANRVLHEERKRAAEEESNQKARDNQGRDMLLRLVAGLLDDPNALDWTGLVATTLLRQGIPPWCGTILTSLLHLTWWGLSNILLAVLVRRLAPEDAHWRTEN
ncbi:hypothetical protein CF336_g4755 [Tilletia laevis]|uniref:Nuclear fusion protein KAR5 n=1 Tax=Tilletia caries TaxID=13290 RepID=A0A177VEG8_9BASI|nr:hypothetical protein CF336_g4755 [Tilletia laevis]KAE8197621.1 hypothetical protein CF335_g4569 [Tilletia laevis]KAE8257773.1 hypothetical protein A4X03_0g4569 [Tilletia caries]